MFIAVDDLHSLTEWSNTSPRTSGITTFTQPFHQLQCLGKVLLMKKTSLQCPAQSLHAEKCWEWSGTLKWLSKAAWKPCTRWASAEHCSLQHKPILCCSQQLSPGVGCTGWSIPNCRSCSHSHGQTKSPRWPEGPTAESSCGPSQSLGNSARQKAVLWRKHVLQYVSLFFSLGADFVIFTQISPDNPFASYKHMLIVWQTPYFCWLWLSWWCGDTWRRWRAELAAGDCSLPVLEEEQSLRPCPWGTAGAWGRKVPDDRLSFHPAWPFCLGCLPSHGNRFGHDGERDVETSETVKSSDVRILLACFQACCRTSVYHCT